MKYFQVLVIITVTIPWLLAGAGRSSYTLESEIDALQREVRTLNKKIDSFSEYCNMIQEGKCGPCRCRDDNRLLKKYYCDCQNLPPKRDCVEYHQQGLRVNGIYKVHQNRMKTVQVFCDQTTDGGGWTVIQRRRDGSIKFYRDWETYKVGFGDLQHEFWFGNENIFTMTLQALYPRGSELRIELEDWEGGKRYAKYSKYQVGNEFAKYELVVGGYSGNANDSGIGMLYHSGMRFSTFDVDNDLNEVNCASKFKGGWWYNQCHYVNLNGRYYDYGEMGKIATGIHWRTFHGSDYSLKHVEMKMRRKI